MWNLQCDQMPATKATEEWWEWKEGQQVVLAGHRDHGLAWWWHFVVVGGGRGGARPRQSESHVPVCILELLMSRDHFDLKSFQDLRHEHVLKNMSLE
eukprot:SAG11_NODE_4922_length_1721_cov_17.228730_2_plen_97_part_00